MTNKTLEPTTLVPFKVGDKVSHPFFGTGYVMEIDKLSFRQVVVRFDSNQMLRSFTEQGFYLETDHKPSLFHGHGDFEVTFTPKKEPVYEWQWEYVGVSTAQREKIWTTGFYQNEKAMLECYSQPLRKDFIRIERSKRLVIN